MPESAKREFLYVPRTEVGEARSLGATYVAGEARMAKPRPMPMGVEDADFDRWRSTGARYRWCIELLTAVLGDLLKKDPGLDGALGAIADKRGSGERVYLFVCAADAPRVRDVPGVRWDRAARMYFAAPDADLNRLFRFMTPEARNAWEAERATIRALDVLVKDEARAEAARRGASGGVGASREEPAVKGEGR